MKIVVIGSLNVDTTYSLPHIPKEGETILATNKTVQRGGKGQNQAIQMARLGAEVSMIGAVGSDGDGKELIDGLKLENIDTTGMIIKEGPSGTASIYVNSEGQNNIVVYPGANFQLTKEDIDSKLDILKNADICVMQNEIPLDVIYHVLELCRKLDVAMVHNPAPAVKEFEKKYLGLIDYFVPNETEMELILNRELDSDVESMAREVLQLGCKNIIITLGSKGSLLVNDEKVYSQEALRVKAVDTTAAGDSYIGGFVAGLARGFDLERAMEYGTISSALTVTKPGAVDALPYRKDVDEMEKRLKNKGNSENFW
ncbi:MAG: ribokinase [Tissierellia bacterium]|jgi:ribokinase|nr:ribokinase [Tissierellia bacterium]